MKKTRIFAVSVVSALLMMSLSSCITLYINGDSNAKKENIQTEQTNKEENNKANNEEINSTNSEVNTETAVSNKDEKSDVNSDSTILTGMGVSFDGLGSSYVKQNNDAVVFRNVLVGINVDSLGKIIDFDCDYHLLNASIYNGHIGDKHSKIYKYNAKGAKNSDGNDFIGSAKLYENVVGMSRSDVENKLNNTDQTNALFYDALLKAFDSAKERGANPTDTLNAYIDINVDRDDDELEIENRYTLVSLDKNGNISAAILDKIDDGDIDIEDNGIVSTDPAIFKTRRQSVNYYDLRARSSIGREWDEQIDSLCEYVRGKNIQNIFKNNIRNGRINDVDMLSKVTIHVSSWLGLIKDAIRDAR